MRWSTGRIGRCAVPASRPWSKSDSRLRSTRVGRSLIELIRVTKSGPGRCRSDFGMVLHSCSSKLLASLPSIDSSLPLQGGVGVVIVATGLIMALRPGAGELEYDMPLTEPLQLRQTAGVMPRRAWGFRPPIRHSHYDPAPWQIKLPGSDEDSLENVDRATDIKRELGSEHPPWERLDRQGP